MCIQAAAERSLAYADGELVTQKAAKNDKKGYLAWDLGILDSRLFARLRGELPVCCTWHDSCNLTLSLASSNKERLNYVYV